MTALEFKPLIWDSAQLGLGCGLIDCSAYAGSDAYLAALVEELIAANSAVEFITLKVPAAFSLTTTCLVRAAAVLVDTELIYHYACPGRAAGKAAVELVRTCEPEDFAALAEAMTTSRLFLDDRIPAERALALWRESIRNHCQGRAELLALARVAGRPAGLVTLNGLNEKAIDLHIVGVLKDYRNLGVGRDLLAAVTNAYGQSHAIEVATSCRNLAAQRLYTTAGFAVASVRHSLHLIKRT